MATAENEQRDFVDDNEIVRMDGECGLKTQEKKTSCQTESSQKDVLPSHSDACELTLTDLPPELLLYVCSFLHARVVACTLSMVSKYFHSIINDVFWKVRIGKRWPKKYPAIPGNHCCSSLIHFIKPIVIHCGRRLENAITKV